MTRLNKNLNIKKKVLYDTYIVEPNLRDRLHHHFLIHFYHHFLVQFYHQLVLLILDYIYLELNYLNYLLTGHGNSF